MKLHEYTEKVLCDLDERGLTVALFVCETKEGKLQVIGYNGSGLVGVVSDAINSIGIIQNLPDGTFRQMYTIENKKKPLDCPDRVAYNEDS